MSREKRQLRYLGIFLAVVYISAKGPCEKKESTILLKVAVSVRIFWLKFAKV